MFVRTALTHQSYTIRVRNVYSPWRLSADHAGTQQHRTAAVKLPPRAHRFHRQAMVDLGQRGGGSGIGTTSPDDTTPPAGAILNHGQKTWALGRPEHNTTNKERKSPGYGGRESRARPTCADSPPASQIRPDPGCRSQTTERQGPRGAGCGVFDQGPCSLMRAGSPK
jgi:hypothetical protein